MYKKCYTFAELLFVTIPAVSRLLYSTMLHHFRKFMLVLTKRRHKELVKKAINGDSSAFGMMYIHHIDAIFRFTFFRVNQKEDIEDITQNIFFKAWENISSFQGTERQFKSWLFAIARNTIIDFYRSKKKFIPLPFNQTDTRIQPEEQIVLNYFKEDFQKALSRLTNEQREVLMLKLVEGLGYQEIAEITGKREDAVRAIQSRALKHLRKTLKHYER